MSAIFKASLSLILKFVPWDTVIAFIVNYAVGMVTDAPRKKDMYDKVLVTVAHAAETLAVTQSALADGVVTSDEVKQIGSSAGDFRLKLIALWAERKPSKEIEETVRKENPELDANMAKIAEMKKAAEFNAARNNS